MDVTTFQAELDFLTGRYVTRRRPTHGRLTSTPSRLSYGAELLEDITIEGTRMRLPTPPRSYPPTTSSERHHRRLGSSESGSPRSALSADVVGDVRVVITPLMRQRLSVLDLRRLLALDLQHSPMYQMLSTQRHSYIHFINSPPWADRFLQEKEGPDRPEDNGGSLQGRSSSCYLSASHESSLRKCSTVRFVASHTCVTSDRPMDDFLEEVSLPAQRWESEAPLDTHSVEMGQACMDLHQHAPGSPLVDPPAVHVEEALEAVVVSNEGGWSEEEEGKEEEGDLSEEERDGVDGGETDAGEGLDQPVTSEDVTDCVVLPTSPSPEAAPAPLRPLPLPPPVEEDPRGGGPEKGQNSGRPKPSERLAQTTGPKAPRPPQGPARPGAVRPAVRLTKPAKAREPREKKVPPKPVPKPRPVKEKKAKHVYSSSDDDGPEDKPIPLPISGPEDLIWTPEPEDEPEPPSPQPPVQLKTRAPVKKKEKLPPPPPRRSTPTSPPSPPGTEGRQPRVSFMDTDSWEEDQPRDLGDKGAALHQAVTSLLQVTALPDFAGDAGGSPRSVPGTRRSSLRSQLATPRGSVAPGKSRWGERTRDASLREQEERERQSENRRRRHAVMVERGRGKKGGDGDSGKDGGGGLEDDGFLAKYCILNASTTDQYRYTFEQLDEGQKGYLTEEETAYGLRAINPSLSTSETAYLYRVMRLAGHDVTRATGFRLFSILAALSQRVSTLDEWARSMMAQLDYKTLERKMFLCKSLWECNVDEDSGGISLDQLMVELRAGGVSPHHQREVRHRLAPLRHLDFLDFLLYVPLFITIHTTVLSQPLTPSWQATPP
ncbi:hypothetical protein ACOMHN_008958 [Nucella lapillus]